MVCPIYKWIWAKILPMKISAFCLKLSKGGVKLDTDVQRYGMVLASKCMCRPNHPWKETTSHLFGMNEILTKVWSHFCNLFGVGYLSNLPWKSFCLQWCLFFKGENQLSILARAIPFLIFWELWKARNMCKFVNKSMNGSWTWIVKSSLSMFYLNSTHLSLLIWISKWPCQKPLLVSCSQLPKGAYKLNVDGSSLGKPGHAGSGGLLRNDKGICYLDYVVL